MTVDAPPPLPPCARPDVPVAATLLTLFVGAGMLAATCAGAAAFAVARRESPEIAKSAARRAAESRARALEGDADSSLDALAARVAASARAAGEFPDALAEAPPNDPWGRPIEYARLAPDRAVLRSAGPDGKFGTKDDVRRDVELK